MHAFKKPFILIHRHNILYDLVSWEFTSAVIAIASWYPVCHFWLLLAFTPRSIDTAKWCKVLRQWIDFCLQYLLPKFPCHFRFLLIHQFFLGTLIQELIQTFLYSNFSVFPRQVSIMFFRRLFFSSISLQFSLLLFLWGTNFRHFTPIVSTSLPSTLKRLYWVEQILWHFQAPCVKVEKELTVNEQKRGNLRGGGKWRWENTRQWQRQRKKNHGKIERREDCIRLSHNFWTNFSTVGW